MRTRFPWFTVYAQPRGARWWNRAAARVASVVHEFFEVCTPFDAHAGLLGRFAARYAIGFDPGRVSVPDGMRGNTLSRVPWVGLDRIDGRGFEVFTIQLTFVGKLTLVGGSDAVGWLPSDSDMGGTWPDETIIRFLLASPGSLTINTPAGVTLNGVDEGTFTLDSLYSVATLVRVDADEWVVFGGAASANIPEPDGVSNDEDDEARAAISAILALLVERGLMVAPDPEE